MVDVEIVYMPSQQPAIHLHVQCSEEMTVSQVLHQSGLLQSHPETQGLPVGIFGTVVPLDQIIKAGDRIEIYRPLIFDPKEKRRQRARSSR